MPRNVQIGVTVSLKNFKGVGPAIKDLQRQLRAAPLNIDIKISKNTSQAINGLTGRINNYSKAVQVATTRTTSFSSALQQLSNIMTQFSVNANQGAAALRTFNQNAKGTASAAKNIQTFSNRFELLGDRVGLAVKRFGAFLLAARPIIAVSRALDEAVSEAIQFQDQMVRLSQITGGSTIRDVAALNKQIQTLAVTFGVTSKEITGIADTFLQAGLKANETRLALEAVTKAKLAPTFTSIEQAGEGLIAMMGQFKIPATEFSQRLSQINTLSAKYAAESDDYIAAIRKSGAAFAGAGGNLEELLALFTSVRATSRESADTIATSFRTIFARLQRPGTVDFLQSLGIQLRDVQGNFVGPFKAILNIAERLQNINPQSQLFAQIVEEIGGIRQVNKVQTLLRQTALAREALSEAQNAGDSIDTDAEKRQESLAVSLTKLSEAFKNLFKTLATDSTVVSTIRNLINLTTNIIRATEALAPLIPLIGGFAILNLGKKAGSFAFGFGKRIAAMASGGKVPGSGNRDSQMAMLMPGEYVLNKKAVQKIGSRNLDRINNGGIPGFAKGGKVYSSFAEFTQGFVEELGLTKEQGRRLAKQLGVTSKPPRPFEVGGKTYVTGEQMSQGYGSSKILTQQLELAKKSVEVEKDNIKSKKEAIATEKMLVSFEKIRARQTQRFVKAGTPTASPIPLLTYQGGTNFTTGGPISPPVSPIFMRINTVTGMSRYAFRQGQAPKTSNLLSGPDPITGVRVTGVTTYGAHSPYMRGAWPFADPTTYPFTSRPSIFNRVGSAARGGFNTFFGGAVRPGMGTPNIFGAVGGLGRRIGGGIRGGFSYLGADIRSIGSNPYFKPAAGNALALSALAIPYVFRDRANQRNVTGAALQGGLFAGGTTLALTGNPFLAAAAAVGGGFTGFSQARDDNKFAAFRNELKDSFSEVDLRNLGNQAQTLRGGLASASKVGALQHLGIPIFASISELLGGENADFAIRTAFDEAAGQARGRRLQELQPELEIQATKIEERIKQLASRGFSAEQIGKQIDLKNAALIVGGARTATPEAEEAQIVEQGKKLIRGMIPSNEPMSRLAKAMDELAKQMESDSQAFKDLQDKLDMAVHTTSGIVQAGELFTGKVAKLNIGGAGSTLALAATGNAANPAVQKALFSTLGGFAGGTELAGQITDIATAKELLNKILPGLSNVSDTANVGNVKRGVLDDLENQFQRQTGRRLNSRVFDTINNALDSALGDKATTADFKSKVQDIGFVDSLFRDREPELEAFRKGILEKVSQLGEHLEETLTQIDEVSVQRFEAIQKQVGVGVTIEQFQRQFAKQDLVDVGLSQRGFLAAQQSLLGIAGIRGAPLDVGAVVGGRERLKQELFEARNRVRESATPENIIAAKELETKFNAASKAVANLTDNIDELNKGPLERLNQIGEEKNARLGFGERILGGSSRDVLQQMQRVLAAQAVIGRGNFNGLNQFQRKLALEGLNELSGFRIGGRLVDDIKKDLIEKSLPGLIPKDLVQEEKDLQKQVIDNLKIQEAAIGANIGSLDFNTDALNRNTDEIFNLIKNLQAMPRPIGRALGGMTRGTDTVPAMLTPGEFVVNRRATERFLPLLMRINSGALSEDDIQFAARGQRIPRKRRGLMLSRRERHLARRGLLDVDRDWWNQLVAGAMPGQMGFPFFQNRFESAIRSRITARAQQRAIARHQRMGHRPVWNNRFDRATARRVSRRNRLGFAEGGIVPGGGGSVEAPWLAQFVSASSSLANAISNMPSTIQAQGNFTHNVIINGNQVLQGIDEYVRGIVEAEISKAFRGNYRGISDEGESNLFRRLDSGLS